MLASLISQLLADAIREDCRAFLFFSTETTEILRQAQNDNTAVARCVALRFVLSRITMTKTRVLFLCTGNSCRSQMAEGFLRHYGKGSIDAFSAGTHPSFVHPLTIEVMKEIGIDISRHRSKSVDEFLTLSFDYVITVCDHARKVCPVFPGARKTLHLPFDDPVQYEGDAKMRLQHFRRVRDEIAQSMEKFTVHTS